MAGQVYAVRNVHSKGLLDYGATKNQEQMIIAMEEDDGELTEATFKKAQVFGNLSLEKVMMIAEYKIAERDAPFKSRWLLADLTTLPTLSAALDVVLGNTNMVKAATSRFLNWLLPGQKLGEQYAAAWLHKVDAALFVHTSNLMPGIKTKEFCLQDLIDFKKLKQMKSLINGIISEIKKESKVKSWTSLLKIILEWRQVVMELTEMAKTPQEVDKKGEKREVDDSEDKFVEATPLKKFKLYPNKKTVEKRQAKDTTKAKEYAKERIRKQKLLNKSIEKERMEECNNLDLEVSLEKEKEKEREPDKSVSDIFATSSEDVDEDSSEEYYNRQPSGKVVSPTHSNHPSTTSTYIRSPDALCASSSSFDHNSSSEEEMEGLTTSTPVTSRSLSSTSTSSSTAISFISPLAKVARTPKNPKSVVMKYLTVAKNPEKDVKNKTNDMTLKCEKLKPRNRGMKMTRYELDSETESETEDEEEKSLKKDLEKTQINPGEVSESLRKYDTVKTPVNLQLQSVKITDKETLAELSDSRYRYQFVISKKISFMLDPMLKECIQNNTVITLTDVKRTKDGRKIVKDWLIQKRKQINRSLGKPVLWEN